MATIIPAYVTEDARRFWPKFLGQMFTAGNTTNPGPEGVPASVWNPQVSHFRVGTGGWVDQGNGVKTRRAPVPNLRRLRGSTWTEGVTTYYLQDIDTVVDADRAGPDQFYPIRSTFLKQLTTSDLTYEAPNILRVRCLLDFDEFNEDAPGSGTNPELWEVGVFTAHPVVATDEHGAPALLMLAYATFPKEIKNADRQIENIVKIQF